MLKTKLLEALEDWSENLRNASTSIDDLANAIEEKELTNKEQVVEFLNEWFYGMGIHLCFDEFQNEITLDYETASYISLDDIERECA